MVAELIPDRPFWSVQGFPLASILLERLPPDLLGTYLRPRITSHQGDRLNQSPCMQDLARIPSASLSLLQITQPLRSSAPGQPSPPLHMVGLNHHGQEEAPDPGLSGQLLPALPERQWQLTLSRGAGPMAGAVLLARPAIVGAVFSTDSIRPVLASRSLITAPLSLPTREPEPWLLLQRRLL